MYRFDENALFIKVSKCRLLIKLNNLSALFIEKFNHFIN